VVLLAATRRIFHVPRAADFFRESFKFIGLYTQLLFVQYVVSRVKFVTATYRGHKSNVHTPFAELLIPSPVLRHKMLD
jgi:hypothetical protein